ncbi:DUF3953 domain-containing protein [Salinicoccus roseus]|uniref:DUF3953 domain-containing protein n=1 Tax=Salinicoccus roseus TaxID=45670 RepID=UPI001CA65B35|nr:DUF3953 domain-containing protein [Salinicoccus roseus]MBY8909028.1 DUF3953 domain-containing protein [Salinicoccus roseus]
MVFVLRLIFAAATTGLALYSLITDNYGLMPWMFLTMSLLLLTMGIDEYLKGRKVFGVFSLLAFAFVFYVSLDGFMIL